MEKIFLLYLSVHWGDLIEQIKKSVIYTLRESSNSQYLIPLRDNINARIHDMLEIRSTIIEIEINRKICAWI